MCLFCRTVRGRVSKWQVCQREQASNRPGMLLCRTLPGTPAGSISPDHGPPFHRCRADPAAAGKKPAGKRPDSTCDQPCFRPFRGHHRRVVRGACGSTPSSMILAGRVRWMKGMTNSRNQLPLEVKRDIERESPLSMPVHRPPVNLWEKYPLPLHRFTGKLSLIHQLLNDSVINTDTKMSVFTGICMDNV